MSADLDRILQLLSSENLRSSVLLPFEKYREEFEPRFLSTSSYDEMMEELGSFVCSVRERWLGVGFDWPLARGVDEARQLLNAELGGGRDSKEGERAAMRACRYGDEGGMRMILNAVTRALQGEALKRYVDVCILPEVDALSAEESMALAEAYLAEFSLPGVENGSPASIAIRWKSVLHLHAEVAVRY